MKYILVSIFLLSCSPEQQAAQQVDWMQDMQYFKDTRTNLCFASSRIKSHGSLLFTSVPCTPELEQEAYRFKSSTPN